MCTRIKQIEVERKVHIKNGGFAIIDAIFGVTIASILAFVFIGSIMQAGHASDHARDRLLAKLAILETYEIAYAVSRQSPEEFDISTCTELSPCHFVVNNDNWTIELGEETLANQLTRSWYLRAVERDNDGMIVASGGIVDQNTLEIVIVVRWDFRGVNESEIVSTYLHLD